MIQENRIVIQEVAMTMIVDSKVYVM